ARHRGSQRAFPHRGTGAPIEGVDEILFGRDHEQCATVLRGPPVERLAIDRPGDIGAKLRIVPQVTRGLKGEAGQHIEPGTRRIPVMLEDWVGGGGGGTRGQPWSRKHAAADQQQDPKAAHGCSISRSVVTASTAALENFSGKYLPELQSGKRS